MNICEGISDLRIYVIVMSLYPRDRGVTVILTLSGVATFHKNLVALSRGNVVVGGGTEISVKN